jgi:hypothetical protein
LAATARAGVAGDGSSGAGRTNNMKRLIARTVARRQGSVLKVCDTCTRNGRVHRKLD